MREKFRFKQIFILISSAILFTCACSHTHPLEESSKNVDPIDNLKGSNNAKYRLNEDKLALLLDNINKGDFDKLNSLIIIHNDSFVLEEYFQGWNRNMRHRCWSVTKSFISALSGIAIEQGYIKGVNEKLLSFFPEYRNIANLDERKNSITLKDGLTMTAGFWCNPDSEKAQVELQESSNWIKYILDQPMNNDPGAVFVYDSGCSHLLSEIIQNTTGKTTAEFAKENLFNPIGVTDWEWKSDLNGITIGGWGLSLRPVDMAIFGYLYLNNGKWNKKQIIPEWWVNESTISRIDGVIADYGYQWWSRSDGLSSSHKEAHNLFLYFAFGYKGQFIFVIPRFNMVVVITSEFKGTGLEVFAILADYIFPAVETK